VPVPTDPQDVEALRACLEGRREAFAARFAGLIAGAVRTAAAAWRVSDPARLADLRQEVFLALLEDGCRRLRRYDPSLGTVGNWVGLLARHITSNRLRREALRRTEALPLQTEAPREAGPERDEEISRMRHALQGLPPREGLCLALLFQQGLTPSQAALVLKVSRQTVHELRGRALEKLRKTLSLPADG
jgi:RNA polymerase sigma factor (sigma-70 family)